MTKDFYDKLDVISNAASKNKAVLMLLITILFSGATNTFQYFKGMQGNFLQEVMKDQITLLATTYVNKECKK